MVLGLAISFEEGIFAMLFKKCAQFLKFLIFSGGSSDASNTTQAPHFVN